MSTTHPRGRRPVRGPNRTAGGWAPALTPRVAVRIAILGGIAMAMLGVLLIRLWFLQVINTEQYAQRADSNRLRTIVTQPPRGNILTRDGLPLVTNTIGQNLVASPRDLGVERVSAKVVRVPARARAELKRLSFRIGVPTRDLMAKIVAGVDQPLLSVVLARNVSPPLYRWLAERRRDYPGISLQQTYLRHYPQGDLAAHLLGTTGPITAETIQQYRHAGYSGDETVGLDGVESQYEPVLKGTPGRSVVEVDAAGEPQGRAYISSQSPVPGRDLTLSIDSTTQRALEAAIAQAAGVTGATGAAGVALDPNTGEVLALASYPTFSPEAFVTRKTKDLNPIYKNPDHPLLDRAISGLYPAGSTFKPITASAALRAGLITPETALDSPAEITLYKQKFHNFQYEHHGMITLPYALRVSSDTFFYQVADKLWNVQRRAKNDYPLMDEARRFGLGKPTGIDLPGEKGGTVPDPAWKKKLYAGKQYTDFQRSWLAGDTIQLGVGQGFLQVTPVQLATAYAAIANGGTVRAPTVGLEVRDPNGRVVQQLAEGRPSHPLNISPTNLEAIKQGLYDAANGAEGTSQSVFGNLPEADKVAGKTGTVETGVIGEEDHSWFVGYAPYDNPKIVVAVVIEHGGTGANAAAPAVCHTMAAFLKFQPNLCGQPVASH